MKPRYILGSDNDHYYVVDNWTRKTVAKFPFKVTSERERTKAYGAAVADQRDRNEREGK
jgi:hypothetical protein